MEEVKNYGVILGQRDTDYVGGTLPYKINNPSGDWTPYLPLEEWQRFESFDTMACVSFSALNVVETFYYFKTGQRKNFSDRFTAKMSNTTPSGNYLYKVADSIRKDGLVDESDYPTPTQFNWENYYSEIPIELKDKGKKFLDEWQVNYEFIDVTRGSLLHHLKQSPIQVVIPGHAIMNFFTNDDVYKYFDQYAPFIKERIEPFTSALKYVLGKKNMLKIIGNKQNGSQYICGKDEILHWIFSPIMLNQLHDSGAIDKNNVTWQSDINGYQIGDPWAPIRNN